jgi:homoserine O-succinyltransferase
LFRGFDDVFWAPHSREVGVLKEDVEKVSGLELIADSEAGGPTILKTTDSKNFFALCHLEYDANTLALEYQRDMERGLNPDIPENYFPDDDPTKEPVVNWRSAGQLLFSNWLNYYVYQTTPYEIGNKFTGK